MQNNSEFSVKKVRSLKYLKSLESKTSDSFSTLFSQYQYSVRKQIHASMRQLSAMALVYTLATTLVFYPFLTNFTKVLADPSTTVTIVNNVVNGFGGTSAASDFTVTIHGTNINGTAATTLSFPGSASGVTVNLDPAFYFVTSTGPTGYSSSNSATCHGTPALGDVNTCTITSNDQQASVLVTTTVMNTNGGVKTPSDFTFNVTGTNATPTSAPGNAAGTMVNLNAGAFSITQTALVGYMQSLSAGCSGTLTPGQVQFCTITESDTVVPTTASLNVINNVVNTNGGTSTPAFFTAHITGSTTPSSFTTSASGTPVVVQPGPYGVTLTGPSNYTYGYSVDCYATVIAGDSKVCTVTSSDVAAPTTTDLSIANVATSTTPSAGDVVTYTLTATNNGLAAATGVAVNNTLSSGVTYSTSTPSQGTFNSGTGIWTVGNLASGAHATLTLKATVKIATGGQTLTNAATISGSQTDPISGNNSASSSVIVNNLAPVISNEAVPSILTTSVTITWTTNHPATSRVIYDTISHPVLAAGPNYGYANSTAEDSTLTLNHSVTVAGLNPGTPYFLRVVTHGSPEAVGSEISAGTGSGSGGGGGGGSVLPGNGGTNTGTSQVTSPSLPAVAQAPVSQQGQVLGATTDIPSADAGKVLGASTSALPKTGIPAQGLIVFIFAAGAVGAIRYKFAKV
jgi:uncharacterized repeat protein (TIGR01451 family)